MTTAIAHKAATIVTTVTGKAARVATTIPKGGMRYVLKTGRLLGLNFRRHISAFAILYLMFNYF